MPARRAAAFLAVVAAWCAAMLLGSLLPVGIYRSFIAALAVSLFAAYVAYLFGDADRPGLVDELPVKREFMSIFYTPGAIVWNIRRADYNRSHITRIAAHPSYGSMTTRNVNTARKLTGL